MLCAFPPAGWCLEPLSLYLNQGQINKKFLINEIVFKLMFEMTSLEVTVFLLPLLPSARIAAVHRHAQPDILFLDAFILSTFEPGGDDTHL